MKLLIDNIKVSTNVQKERISPSPLNVYGNVELKSISNTGSGTLPLKETPADIDTRYVSYDIPGAVGDAESFVIEESGLYYIKLRATATRSGGLSGSNTDCTFSPLLYINGVEFLRGNRRTRTAAPSAANSFNNGISGGVETTVFLEKGDYFRFLFAISIGGVVLDDRTINSETVSMSYIQITRLDP